MCTVVVLTVHVLQGECHFSPKLSQYDIIVSKNIATSTSVQSLRFHLYLLDTPLSGESALYNFLVFVYYGRLTDCVGTPNVWEIILDTSLAGSGLSCS